MRENIMREIVTRLMTDAEFRDQVMLTPPKALMLYNLDTEEISALSQMEVPGMDMNRVNVLEKRISASTLRNTMLSGDDECGCCPKGLAICQPCPK
jgi:hypothetical protein